MLTPQENPAGYQQGALLQHATNIQNNQYLLIHGTGDDNVHFENTAELAEVTCVVVLSILIVVEGANSERY
jgi:dipeptidyl aminopeptidase/acylaminoacyl peptidase